MRKLLSPYNLITVLLVGVSVFALPQFAHAAIWDGILNGLNFGANWFYGLIAKVFWWGTIPLTSWVLWLVGVMIDGIIALSSDPSFYNAPAISASWGIVRDVCNMLFIFILIYEGIRTILNLGNMVSVKTTIAGVILAAVFINFSLFATKVVIDVSNITAAWFIQGVKNVGGTESISDAVVASLQMKKLVQNKDYGRGAMTKESFVAGLAMTVLNCVAIYVMFKVFFLLLGRLITFMFLLVTAPIGFVGPLLPQLKKYAEKWWNELNSMAIMAPMFFLMLYITLFIIDQVDTFVFGGAGSADPVTGSSFAPTNYIMFAIIIAMLLKVLEITEEYSGEMAGKIGELFKSSVGVALGGVTAVGGVIGRQTLGRAAFNITQDDKKMGALRSEAATSLFGKVKLAAVTKGASSSFDARATTVGGKALGAFNPKISVAGISVDASKVGKTESGGFKAGAEAFAKKEKDWAEKNLGKGAAGEINRMRFSESMQKGTLLTNYNKLANAGVGKNAYKDAYRDIEKAARDNFRKKTLEDAKKGTKDISNKIVDEQMAIYQMEEAIKSNNNDQINAALETEKNRIEGIWSEMEKNALEKNKAAHIEYSLTQVEKRVAEPGPVGEAARATKTSLEKELADLRTNMTADEKNKASEEAEKLRSYKDYKEKQVDAVKSAIEESNPVAKKELTKGVIGVIKTKRIGEREEFKDEEGKKKKVAPKGTLNWELDKKKTSLKEAQEELDAIEGKKEEKKDEKKEDKKEEGDSKKK